MELFEILRLKVGASKLEKKLAGTKRKRSFTNFNNVKRIGIVWDASVQDDFAKLSVFFQKMSARNIIVDILGYYPDKELPDKYTAVRYLKCFKRNDVNMFFIPTGSEPAEFIKTEYDILLDMNFKNVFPLKYITCLSKARFKVGLAEPEGTNSTFDLMLEIKNNRDIDNYLTQVIYYLEMINGSDSSSAKSVQSIKN